MPAFETMHLPETTRCNGTRWVGRANSAAHRARWHGTLRAGAGCISKAAVHRTVDEIGSFLSGKGQMWREQHGTVLVTDVSSGVCITIPCGTQFQFRASGDEPLCIVGVTMPPWPGGGEAAIVPGAWQPTV